MNKGDTVTCDGEQVTIIRIDPDDGYIQVLYSDGDKVWTPPDRVVPLGAEG